MTPIVDIGIWREKLSRIFMNWRDVSEENRQSVKYFYGLLKKLRELINFIGQAKQVRKSWDYFIIDQQ
jgi:hypothetical protein